MDRANGTVACVVVTYKRRELLRQCLTAIGNQTRAADRLVVVDNASGDGTTDLVRKEFGHAHLLTLNANVGGAGGFKAGIRHALDCGADWIWLLDDDVIASPDALASLLDAASPNALLPEPVLLASRVNWTDGRPHPMNLPILRRRDPQAVLDAVSAGLLALRSATFVSVLVSAQAVRTHGLPLAGFFFQADDVEFTARLLKNAHGYLVPQSVVEHRTGEPHTFMSDPLRFYHHVRNTLYMIRGRAWTPAEKVALAWVVVDSSVRFVTAHRGRGGSISAVARAVRDGMGRLPT